LVCALFLVKGLQASRSSHKTLLEVASVILCLSLIFVELIALVTTLVNPSYATDIKSVSYKNIPLLVKVSLSFFNLVYVPDLTAGLVFVLMVSAAMLVLLNRLFGVIPRAAYPHLKVDPAYAWASLVGLAIMSGIASEYPYHLGSSPIGVDMSWYLLSLGTLEATGKFGVLAGEPRAVFLILCYGVHLLTGLSNADSIMAGAAALSVLVIVGSFFFVREASQRDDLALLSALMAVLSPQLLVELFAGIFDDWLAFAELLFFCCFLLRSVRGRKKFDVLASCLILVLLMVTHLWTWVVVMVVLALYIMFSLGLPSANEKPRPSTMGLRIFVVGVIVAGGAMLLTPYTALRTAVQFGFGWALANISSPVFLVQNLQITLSSYVQGFFSNWPLVVLSILGLVAASFHLDEGTSELLSAWVLGPTLLASFFGPAVQWRLIFLIPFPILGAFGLPEIISYVIPSSKDGFQSFDGAMLFYLTKFSCLTAILLILVDSFVISLIRIAAAF